MKKIDIKECQGILLNIAKATNKVCENHGIPFYMLGGTMLGAIRHKGFIPWDDDMDFGVPYERYHELISVLNKELPFPYVCSTFENSSSVISFFAKVEDSSTVVEDARLTQIKKQRGINIDIFPLVSCEEKEWNRNIPKIQKLQTLKRIVYVGSTTRNKFKNAAKRILKAIFPISSKQINRAIAKKIDKIRPGNYYCNIVSPHFWSIALPKYYFEDMIVYDFEDTRFLGISNYDEYLSKLYKNYMKLPPKEKQEVHLDNVYLK